MIHQDNKPSIHQLNFEAVIQRLIVYKWNRGKASQSLGISESTLYNYLRREGVNGVRRCKELYESGKNGKKK